MSGKQALQHQTPLTWHSRNAPRCLDAQLPPSCWRERAARHRQACPVLKGNRPPRPAQIQYAQAVESPVPDEIVLPILAEPPPLGNEVEPDGDCWGVLARVELSRYIAHRTTILSAIAEASRLRHAQELEAAGSWSVEVPGAHADDVPGLEHTAAWATVLEALTFERQHLRRGQHFTQWPDVLWSPQCLGPVEAAKFESRLTDWIQAMEAQVDSGDCKTRDALKALPVSVLLRQLLADARCASGDLLGASKILAGAVAREAGADPLRPPLLIGWEDSLQCNYVKAQQCARLARVALLAVEAQPENASNLSCREALQREVVAHAVSSARRLLKDARRLIEAELVAAEQHVLQQQSALDLEEHWHLALRCSRVLVLELQATAARLGKSHGDAQGFLRDAADQTVILQADEAATPRLQRLLAALRQRLLQKCSDFEN